MSKVIKKRAVVKKKSTKSGRPFAITKEKEEILVALLSDGMSQTKACKYVGVSEETIIQHKKRFPEFPERIEKAMLETHKLAHKSIKVGMTKDWKAGAWWLERTEPERFREKKEIEFSEKPSLVQDMFEDEDKDKTKK